MPPRATPILGQALAPRWRLTALLLVGWTALFAASRLLFLAYASGAARALPVGMLLGTFRHGLRMDLAVAACMTVVPVLILVATVRAPGRAAAAVLAAWAGLVATLTGVVSAADFELFRLWGHRTDEQLLLYLSSPHEMWAAAGESPVKLLTVCCLILVGSGMWHAAGVFRRARILPAGGRGTAAGTLALLAPLLVLARGGLGTRSLNEGSVYFSSSDFANQATLNPLWNLAYAARGLSSWLGNPYAVLPDGLSVRLADSLLSGQELTPRPAALLAAGRPNIVLVLWEGLPAGLVASQGGVPGVTPCLDSLAGAGVRFDRLYASGDRTDKGVVAVLSGYPAPPRGSFLEHADRVKGLPFLASDLARAGYHSTFLYGGALEFAQLKPYLERGGFDSLIGEAAFPRSQRTSQWGVHDSVAFSRALTTLRATPRPFFATILTLSSHEPYDIPVGREFSGNDLRSRMLNAYHYTDRSLCAFVHGAAREPWWSNALLIVVADHSHRIPGTDTAGRSRAPELTSHIPMVWAGGALARRGVVVSRLGAQTAIAPTLLAELGLDRSAYRWGRDLLSPDPHPFAYYSFYDGFGFVTDSGVFVWDNVGRRELFHAGRVDDALRRAGLAFQQVFFAAHLRVRGY